MKYEFLMQSPEDPVLDPIKVIVNPPVVTLSDITTSDLSHRKTREWGKEWWGQTKAVVADIAFQEDSVSNLLQRMYIEQFIRENCGFTVKRFFWKIIIPVVDTFGEDPKGVHTVIMNETAWLPLRFGWHSYKPTNEAGDDWIHLKSEKLQIWIQNMDMKQLILFGKSSSDFVDIIKKEREVIHV